MKVQSLKQQYVFNGIVTLTEGASYRVKSGPFRGMVGKFRSLERQYPRGCVGRCLTGAPVSPATEAAPELPETLAGLEVEWPGSAERAHLEVEILNLELAE